MCLHVLDITLGIRHAILSGTDKLSVLVRLSKQLKYRMFRAMRDAVQWSFITEAQLYNRVGKAFQEKKKKENLQKELHDKLERGGE